MLDKQTILEAFGVDTRKPQELVQFARQEATDLGIDPDVAERLINVESGGNPNAVSEKWAFGPAQLMPGTARDLAAKYGGDPADPHDNIRLGLRYLRDNLNEFDGDYTLASAAYHAGPGAVRRAGGVPNTSDGKTRTSDYSAAVAGGAHTLVKEHDLRDYGDEDPLLTLAHRWTPMYAETPESSTEEQTPKTSTAGDLGHALKIGWTTFAQDLAEVVKRVPLVGQPIYDLADKFDQWRTGQTTDDLLKGDIKEQFGRISPEMQKASQEKWWDEEKGWFGPAMTDWRSWAYGLTTNLPEQAGMMLPAMRLAKAAYAAKAGSMLADGTFTAIAERELAAGVTREAAATAAAQEVMKVAGKSAAAAAGLGGGTIEGLLGGAQSSRQVRDELMAAPEDALLKFDSYKALVVNGMSPQEARKALAEDQATQAFILSGVATGLFAGMGDRLMAKVWTGNLEGGVLKRFLYGGTVEALPEEFPQDYLQQVAENYALQKPLTEGALNQAVAGAAMAFVQGGAFAVPFGPQSIQRPPTVDDTLTRIKDATTTDEAIAVATEHVNINSDVARQDLNESLRQQWEMRNAAEAEAAIQTVAETRVEAQAAREEEAVTAAVRQEQAVKEAPPQAQYETTMRAIEARGGQATHAEAALLARAGQGAPYDSIIDSPKVAGTSLSSISTERLESLKKLAGTSDTAARIADEIAIRSAGQFASDIASARTAGQEADHTGSVLFSEQRDKVDHQAIVNDILTSRYNATAQVIPDTVLSNEKVQQIPGVMTPATHRVMKLAANLVGKDLVLFAVDSKDPSTDGFVVQEAPNTVYLNVATKDASPVAVFWHEITHHMEREEPQLFQALKSALMEEGVLKDTTTPFLEGREHLSPEQRFNEIIGDLTGNAMTVPETWHGIFSRIADHETVRKIADYIKRMLGHFIRRSNLKQFEDTGRLVNDVRKVQKAVAEAVSQYVERKKAKEAKNETETPQEDRDQHLPGAAAEDRQSAQREAPTYGKESPASVSVVGTHYSRIGRTRLSGQYFGSGLKGAERSRLDSAPAILRDRLYFYVDEGKGTFPEEGVGAFAHTTNLTNLYDAIGDPLSLWNSKDNNGSELAILNAGFDGYYVRGAFGNQGVAVLIGKHYDVPTQAVGTGPQGPSGQVAPPIKTNPIRAMATRLAQSRALPDGEMDMGSWERILESLDPEIADALKTKGVFNEPGKFYKSELAAKLLRPAAVQESAQRGGEYGEMDTRTPTQRGTKINLSNLKAMKAAPEMFEKNIALVTQSLMYREADTYNTPEKQAERFVQVATKNLLWLHDQFPAGLRDRAKLWYVGANKLASEASERYGITPQQAAAVYATLSPQLDWFRNVDLGDRVLDAWFNHRNDSWTSDMDVTAEALLPEGQVSRISGKSLVEQTTDIDRARWIRVFDEAHGDRGYQNISPEGERIGPATNITGLPSRAGWMNGMGPVANAVSVLENGTLDNIDAALGGKHKVRNFYNNILYPDSPLGHVTVDTHAVAAAHLLPFSGSSREVGWNFGGGSSSSAPAGLSGTYPLYLEAYTRAAKARGVLPREMQSITWEAVRGLFKTRYKANINALRATNDAWTQYKKGRSSLEATREQILRLAGGIDTPSWARRSSDSIYEGAEDSPDDRGLPEGSLREGGSSGRVAESAQRALFEVAPNPDNAERYARWAALPQEEQLRISRSVADDVVPRILGLLGAKGSVSIQFGGYEGTHNISFAINLESGDIDRVSKAIGYVLDQKSMVTIGGKEGSPAGAVLVTVPDATFASVSDIYTRLWTQAQIVGHTTVGNTMTILNDGSVPLSDLENSIRSVLGDEFEISTDPEASASFPSSEEYGIEKESKYVKSVLDSLRFRAAVAVDAGKVMESGQRQTETPEFKRWFGNSKVVDENGNPLVVYHSTYMDFTSFKKSPKDIGIHFGTAEQANDRGLLWSEKIGGPFLGFEYAPNQQTMPVYLSIKNPIRFEDVKSWDKRGLKDQLKKMFPESVLRIDRLSSPSSVRDFLEDMGYDGVVYKNRFEVPGAANFRRKRDAARVDFFKSGEETGSIEEKTLSGAEDALTAFLKKSNGEDSWIAFRPEQIKSAVGNKGTFNPSSSNILESGQRFYSKLQRVISELPPKLSSQPAAQWLAWLNSNAAKLGIKKDEIYWSGVEEFLRMQQGKVSKEQVVDYLENNGVRVEETVLSNDNLDTRMPEGFELTNTPNGGVRLEYNDGDTRIVVLKNTLTGAFVEMQDRLGSKARRVQLDEADDSTASKRLFSAAEAMDTLMENRANIQPKFEQYVLPGGTNYREVLLTLPGKEVFQSSHWDKSNVLAHLRVDDRMDSDGGKVLFVEEIQSDWGQKGKKKGFSNKEIEARIKRLNEEAETLAKDREMPSNRIREEKRWHAVKREVEELTAQQGDVPVAPFVTKTENWVTLALKRIIQMAVDGGYDKVAFVNGEQSAERYDLSKQVSKVKAWARQDGSLLVQTYDTGNTPGAAFSVTTEEELADHIGEEAAERLMQKFEVGPNTHDNSQELSDLDLKIGGEGMRAFYDKIVPQVANDVLKRFGGEKIGMVDIQPKPSEGESAARKFVGENQPTMPQPGFTVSQQLKDSVSGGVPLFSAQRGIYQAAHLKHLTQDQVDMINHVVGKPLTWRERVDRLVANAGIKLSQGIADQFAPIKEISYKGYMLARMSKGSDGTLEAALLHGVPRLVNDVFHIDTKDGGFLERLKALRGEQDLFFLWVAGNRAEQLAKQGRENLFRPQDIVAAKSLNQGTMPDGTQRSTVYAKALRDLQEFQKAVLDIAEARGIIDGASRHVWESQFYVPFYRNMEDGTTGPSIKSGLVNQYAFKKLKGSSKQLHEDLMANTLMNWSHLLSASAKNVAAKESIDSTVALGAAYPVPSGTKGSVSYLENGDEKHFRIEDPFILDAVSALSFGSFNDPLSKLMGTMKRYLTIGVTAMPQFKIRNLIRDSISSIAQTDLSYNIAGNVIQGLKASNPKSQTYIDMLANGGLIRFGTMLDGNRADYTRRLLEKGIPADSILDTAHKVTGVLETIWEKYKDLGDRFENANRAALYQQLRAKGVSELEANYQARDLLDFSMGGSWKAVRYLSQVTPFFNARIQGLYKLGREGKENPAKLAVVLGAVVMYSMALLAAYHDDDDWKKREDWDRDNYWWFKFAGQAYRIPKPFELGAVATLVERTAELMFDQEMDGQRFGERVGSLLSNNLSLIQLPQLIKPLVDTYANKDSFTGRQIESMGLENLPSTERKTSRTSNVAELLGELGLPNPVAAMQGQYDPLSPVKIDFLIRGYFGGIGTSLLAAVDVAANPFRDKSEPPEKQLRDTFLIGSFVESLPTNSSRYVSHFYKQAKEVNEAYALYQSRLKIGDLAGAQAVMAKNESKLKLQHSVSEVSRLMGSLNLQIRRVEASRELTPQAKRSLIDEIRARQDTLARSVSSPAQ